MNDSTAPMVRKPNLFVIGASKCGTTSLHDYLALHPEIVMSTFKEPRFFVEDSGRHPCVQPSPGSRETSLELYLQLFPEMERKTYAGESTTDYTWQLHRPGVAERIFRFNPDARLVYIVRDPVERTMSHYWFYSSNNAETCPCMLTAIQRQPRHYCDASDYARQLREYLRFFRREQIYITTLEELTAQPALIMGELFEWLRLPPPPGHSNELYSDRKNVTPKTFQQPRFKFHERIRRSGLFARLRFVIPKAARQATWGFLTSDRVGFREVNRSQVAIGPTVAFLRELQLPQVREFEQLCGREFPQWTTVWGTALATHAR